MLVWACTENGRKENSQKVLYMNLGTTRLRGRPRNRWQDEVREDGRIVGGEGWKEKVHNGEEWQKLLRTARNHCILHMPMEWMKYLLPLSWIKPQFIGHPAHVVTIQTAIYWLRSTQYSSLVRNYAQQLCPQSAAMYMHTTADDYTHFNLKDATSLTTFCAPVLLACCECCHNAAHHTKVLLNLAKSVSPNTQTTQQYSRWVHDITPC